MRLAVRLERLGLAPAAVERDHQLPPGALAGRLRGHRARSSGTSSSWRPWASRASASSSTAPGAALEPAPLARGVMVVRELGQRRAAHERERLGERRLGGGRVAGRELRPPGRDQRLEAVRVDAPGAARSS